MLARPPLLGDDCAERCALIAPRARGVPKSYLGTAAVCCGADSSACARCPASLLRLPANPGALTFLLRAHAPDSRSELLFALNDLDSTNGSARGLDAALAAADAAAGRSQPGPSQRYTFDDFSYVFATLQAKAIAESSSPRAEVGSAAKRTVRTLVKDVFRAAALAPASQAASARSSNGSGVAAATPRGSGGSAATSARDSDGLAANAPSSKATGASAHRPLPALRTLRLPYAAFEKLCSSARLVDRRLTPTALAVLFAGAKSERDELTFEEFEEVLARIARAKGMPLAHLAHGLRAAGAEAAAASAATVQAAAEEEARTASALSSALATPRASEEARAKPTLGEAAAAAMTQAAAGALVAVMAEDAHTRAEAARRSREGGWAAPVWSQSSGGQGRGTSSDVPPHIAGYGEGRPATAPAGGRRGSGSSAATAQRPLVPADVFHALDIKHAGHLTRDEAVLLLGQLRVLDGAPCRVGATVAASVLARLTSVRDGPNARCVALAMLSELIKATRRHIARAVKDAPPTPAQLQVPQAVPAELHEAFVCYSIKTKAALAAAAAAKGHKVTPERRATPERTPHPPRVTLPQFVNCCASAGLGLEPERGGADGRAVAFARCTAAGRRTLDFAGFCAALALVATEGGIDGDFAEVARRVVAAAQGVQEEIALSPTTAAANSGAVGAVADAASAYDRYAAAAGLDTSDVLFALGDLGLLANADCSAIGALVGRECARRANPRGLMQLDDFSGLCDVVSKARTLPQFRAVTADTQHVSERSVPPSTYRGHGRLRAVFDAAGGAAGSQALLTGAQFSRVCAAAGLVGAEGAEHARPTEEGLRLIHARCRKAAIEAAGGTGGLRSALPLSPGLSSPLTPRGRPRGASRRLAWDGFLVALSEIAADRSVAMIRVVDALLLKAPKAPERAAGTPLSARQKAALPPSKKAIKEAFRSLDRNANGVVDKRELILAIRRDPALAKLLGLPPRVRMDDGTREVFEATFQAADTDNSKSLDLAEFERFFAERQWRVGGLNGTSTTRLSTPRGKGRKTFKTLALAASVSSAVEGGTKTGGPERRSLFGYQPAQKAPTPCSPAIPMPAAPPAPAEDAEKAVARAAAEAKAAIAEAAAATAEAAALTAATTSERSPPLTAASASTSPAAAISAAGVAAPTSESELQRAVLAAFESRSARGQLLAYDAPLLLVEAGALTPDVGLSRPGEVAVTLLASRPTISGEPADPDAIAAQALELAAAEMGAAGVRAPTEALCASTAVDRAFEAASGGTLVTPTAFALVAEACGWVEADSADALAAAVTLAAAAERGADGATRNQFVVALAALSAHCGMADAGSVLGALELHFPDSSAAAAAATEASPSHSPAVPAPAQTPPPPPQQQQAAPADPEPHVAITTDVDELAVASAFTSHANVGGGAGCNPRGLYMAFGDAGVFDGLDACFAGDFLYRAITSDPPGPTGIHLDRALMLAMELRTAAASRGGGAPAYPSMPPKLPFERGLRHTFEGTCGAQALSRAFQGRVQNMMTSRTFVRLCRESGLVADAQSAAAGVKPTLAGMDVIFSVARRGEGPVLGYGRLRLALAHIAQMKGQPFPQLARTVAEAYIQIHGTVAQPGAGVQQAAAAAQRQLLVAAERRAEAAEQQKSPPPPQTQQQHEATGESPAMKGCLCFRRPA